METAQNSLKWEQVVDYARRYEVHPSRLSTNCPVSPRRTTTACR